LILAFVVFNPGDLYYLGYKKFIIKKNKKNNNNNNSHDNVYGAVIA